MSQKVPRNAILSPSNDPDRYIRLLICVGAGTLATRFYANNAYFTALLIRAGKYSWLCDPASDLVNTASGFVECSAQSAAITNLFNTIMCCEFIGGVISGFLMDSLGFRMMGIAGLGLQFLALALFSLSTSSFNAMLPAGIFSGLAINMVGNIMLNNVYYFPDKASLIGALTIGAQCTSSSVLPILLYIANVFRISDPSPLFLTFAVFGIAPFVVLCFVYLDDFVGRKKTIGENDEDDEYHNVVESRQGSEYQRHSGTLSSGSSYMANRNREIYRKSYASDRETCKSDAGTKSIMTELWSTSGSVYEAVDRIGMEVKGFVESAFSPEFLIFGFVNFFMVVLFMYYDNNMSLMTSPDVQLLYGKLMPLQTGVALLWGTAMDYLSTGPTLTIHFILYGTIYLLSFSSDSPMLNMIAMLIFFSIMPSTFALKYNVVMTLFESKVAGSLLGIINGTSAFVFVVIRLMSSVGDLRFWAMVCAISATLLIIPSLYLGMLQKRAERVKDAIELKMARLEEKRGLMR